MSRRQPDENTQNYPQDRVGLYPYREMAEEHLLLVAEDDELIARTNFDKIFPTLWEFVENRLRILGIHSSDADEISPEVIEQIWASRTKIRARTSNGWFAFVRKVVTFKVSKYFEEKNRGEIVSIDDLFGCDELADVGFESILGDVLLGNPVKDLADRVWLKSKYRHCRQGSEMAIVIAPLRYFEGKDWREIVRLWPQLQFRTEVDLDGWLSQNVSIQEAAFLYLYFPPNMLFRYLNAHCQYPSVRQASPLTIDLRTKIDQLDVNNESLRFYIIVEHFLRGATISSLKKRVAKYVEESSVDALFHELNTLLPFKERSEKLAAYIARHDSLSQEECLEICKRLAFQYHAIDDFKPRQIAEMIFDISASLQCKINDSTLSNWLTRGRLYDELEKRSGEAD